MTTPPSAIHPPAKQAAGEAAAGLVEDGMVLGLGTGSTVAAFLDALATRRDRGEIPNILGLPTSERTGSRALELGIPVTTADDVAQLDLVVDGADELTPRLELTKGGGGALLREKVVAAMGRRFVVIADAAKVVDRLGDSFALPVEVVPFAVAPVTRRLSGLGGVVARRQGADGPASTDNGNALLDVRFPGGIEDPQALATTLSCIPGVAEHGLFLGLASEAILADASGALQRLVARGAV